MKNTKLLEQVHRYWDALADFRDRRDRHKRYAFGNQWSDRVTVDGEEMTEEQLIRREGATPLKNNFLSRFVRNVVGVYRSQAKEPSCVARDRNEAQMGETMSTVLQCNWQLNRMNELLAAVMKEFLISGAAIVRKSWGTRSGKADCWTDIVNPTRFFVDDTMNDVRGWDIHTVGELKDLTFDDLLAEFATTPDDVDALREIYRPTASGGGSDFGRRVCADNFLTAADPSMCRVIEVWNSESTAVYICHDPLYGSLNEIEAADSDGLRAIRHINRQRRTEGRQEIDVRWKHRKVWVYRCLAPDGTVLRELRNPYAHGTHPYVFKFHPFIDGEIHSFIEDVIDQQRYVNRLITLYDWTLRSSAKGVLLFPEKCVPHGMTLDDIGNLWARYNSIIPMRSDPTGAMPHQITTAAANSGIHDLLSFQLRFFEEISGVNGALQGKPGYAGISASLYAQQTQNATLSLLDLLEAFSDFVVQGAYMDVKIMQQFYDPERFTDISGASGNESLPPLDDPERIRDIEFDLAVTETTATGAYRQLANDYLRQLWSAGEITAEQYLRFGDFPSSRDLLNEIESKKE